VITWASAQLRNQRAAVWAAIASLADQAATENRAFTWEDSEQWAASVAELERLDRKLSGALAAEQESASAGAS
jgi:hypothetical protein